MKKTHVSDVLLKQRYKVLFTAILLLHIVCLIYTGFQKGGLHIDEFYSFILSNSYEADRISNAPSVWNQWINGNFFHSFLSVEEGEQFAYGAVYEHNAKDAHPPLFYFLLHTICSFLPGFWSPWIGIGMNIVLIVLTQVVLYKLSRELMGNTAFSLVPAAIYGGMQLFFDTALYIRMYPLLTFLTILLALQHYYLVTSKNTYKISIFCGILTFLGTFTQYYFAILAFFLAAFSCLFFFVQKKWKPLFVYAASMLIGVICVFLVFPAGITQITGSETNNVGKEIASNLFNFSGWGFAVLSMAKQMLFGIFIGIKQSLPAAVLCTVITAIALFVFKGKEKNTGSPDISTKCVFLLCLLLATVLCLTVLTISHISGKFVYVRYLYNIFPLVALLFGLILWLLASRYHFSKRILAWGIIAISIISTATIAKNNTCSYLFLERTEIDKKIIEHCEEKPLVVLNNGSTYQPTSLLHILIESNQIYMANYNEMDCMDAVLAQADCSNGVVFLILTDTYWSDGFDGDSVMTTITSQSEFVSTYDEIGRCEFSTAYIALPS